MQEPLYKLPVCDNIINIPEWSSLTFKQLISALLLDDCWAVIVFDKENAPKVIFNYYAHYEDNTITEQKAIELRRREYYCNNPTELLKYKEIHIYLGLHATIKCVLDHYGRRTFYSE